MNKHTHRGNCQVCGALQAVTPIAKHGYKVKGFGFFMGTCPGSGFEPLQVSRVKCDEVCASLLVNAAEHEALVADYQSGARVPDMAMTDRSEWVNKKRVTKMLPWSEAPDYYRDSTIRQLTHQHAQQARFARFHVRDMQALALKIQGQPLVPVSHKPAPVEIRSGLQFDLNGTVYTVSGRYGNKWGATCLGSIGNKVTNYFTPHAIRAALRASAQVSA